MSLFVLSEILRLFLETLVADDKYSLLNQKNLLEPIRMQLSKKQNSISQFFAPFLKSMTSFEHFKKQNDRHSLCIFDFTDSERHG